MTHGLLPSAQPARQSAAGRLIRGVAAVSTTALVVAALGSASPATATEAVPVAEGGRLVLWGLGSSGPARAIPASLSGMGFTAVAAGPGFTVALTAAGRVVGWGNNSTGPQNVPASLTGVKVTAIASADNNAGAVTADGRVVVWGQKSLLGDPTKVPASVSGVRDLAIGTDHGVALKTNGTVVAWGRGDRGATAVPAGLTGVVDIAAGPSHTYALKSDGTVVAWGRNSDGQTDLPAAVTTPGNVKDVDATAFGGLALLNDGSLINWGGSPIPDSLTGKTITAIDAQNDANLVLDSTGTLTQWTGTTVNEAPVPAELSGAPVAAISTGAYSHSAVIVTAVRIVAPATVTGTAKVGQTLTAKPATFSGGPTTVTNEWLADGAPLTGVTGSKLSLTAAHLGKRISYRSTAVKDGASVPSTSTATAAVTPPQVVSSVRASAGGVRYGVAPRVAVSLSPAAASGRVDVFRGGSRLGSANAVGGRATVVLGRTALPVGTHTLSVRYAGNSATLPSSGSVRVSVAKASSGLRAKVSPKKIVRKKTKAKVAVRISSTSPVKSGRVTVKLGKKTIGKATVSRSGRVTVKLKKFPKAGTVKIKVIYSGNGTTGAVSKTVKVKVRR